MKLAYVDAFYAARRVAAATSIAIEVVRKIPGQVALSFTRRWVVKRRFAWINRNRRLAKGSEATKKCAGGLLILSFKGS